MDAKLRGKFTHSSKIRRSSERAAPDDSARGGEAPVRLPVLPSLLTPSLTSLFQLYTKRTLRKLRLVCRLYNEMVKGLVAERVFLGHKLEKIDECYLDPTCLTSLVALSSLLVATILQTTMSGGCSHN